MLGMWRAGQLLMTEKQSLSLQKHFCLKDALFPTEKKVSDDNDGLYPKIINLQMETSIHMCSL